MLICFGIYLTIAILLDFKYDLYIGDAMSRLANGSYVIYSRDPHLAAVGFVWEPLQSYADLVFLLFRDVWHPLASRNMAGSLVSVLAMVGAVHQLHSALAEWGVRRPARLALTFLFAVNPMVLLFSGNGMSEALYLFTMIGTARYLMRWLRDHDISSLVYSGSFVGLAYLARNEAVASGLACIVLVLVASYLHEKGKQRPIMNALTDTTIFSFPFLACFAGWAIVSFVITGQAFGQLQSQYGVAQVKAAGQGRNTHHAAILWLTHVLEHMAPVLPIVIVVALLIAWRRRDWTTLAPIATLGAALAFDMLSYFDNRLITSYRYFITSIPLLVLLVGGIVTSRRRLADGSLAILDASKAPVEKKRSVRLRIGATALAATIAAIAVIGPTLVTTATGMMSTYVSGNEESLWLGYILHKHWTRDDRKQAHNYATILSIGNYISGLHLPNGDVIVDNFSACIPQVIVTISDPKVFVIPNDRDFQKTLAAPLVFHAHYILEANPTGTGSLTAVAEQYPNLWNSGGGFATDAHNLNSKQDGFCPTFRLFRVNRNPDISG